MNLLLIYDDEHTMSHFIYIYIYIKQVERLFDICKTSVYNDKHMVHTVMNLDIMIYLLKNIYLKTHLGTKHNCDIQLPHEGDNMVFFN